jgi:hypothetical protein
MPRRRRPAPPHAPARGPRGPRAALAGLTAALLLLLAPPRAIAAAPAAPATAAADSIRYVVAITDINRVGLTVSNYGFFGNNFNNRSPSFEFPLGSGYEHMSRAGLWVGARAISDTGRFVGVSAGIVDNAQGTSGQSETEFTPAGNEMIRRSRIQNSRFYSPLAISDQDFECTYSDLPARAGRGYQTERHTPLNLLVRQRSLVFSLAAADAFVVMRFDVVNQGPPLENVYVGLYAQFTSGSRNAYSSWPPSSASGPGSWYYKTHVDYDAARRLYKEHYCLSAPYPASCNFSFCPPWAGMELLRVSPGNVSDHVLSMNEWSWSPGDTLRDTDVERYALMSNGASSDLAACVPGDGCSPIALLSIGPFAQVNPGDTVSVDYAFVAGDDEDALTRYADYAHFAASIDYRLPAPPPSPLLRVETGEGRVDFYWDDSPENVTDDTSLQPDHKDFEGYRLYLSLDRQHLTRVAQFDRVDSTGFNTGLDAVRLDPPRVVDGVTYRYRYRMTGLKDGFSYYGAVTSYDMGDIQVSSLESGIGQNKFQAVPAPAPGELRRGVTVFPNPYRVEAAWDHGTLVRDHFLWFANLPRLAELKIFTLSGDLLYETRFDGSSYHGQSARGLYDPKQDIDTEPPSLSGGTFAWNLITRQGQAIASGLYLFTVEDLESGRTERGKFLVIKSDREQN